MFGVDDAAAIAAIVSLAAKLAPVLAQATQALEKAFGGEKITDADLAGLEEGSVAIMGEQDDLVQAIRDARSKTSDET